MDEVLLHAAVRRHTADPGKYLVTGTPLSVEAYAIMILMAMTWRFRIDEDKQIKTVNSFNSGASNFALTSSISALVARVNGQPVKTVYA